MAFETYEAHQRIDIPPYSEEYFIQEWASTEFASWSRQLRVVNFRRAHKLSTFGLEGKVYRVQITCREQKEANGAFKTLLLQSVAQVVTNACETGFPSAKSANGKFEMDFLKQPLGEWLSNIFLR